MTSTQSKRPEFKKYIFDLMFSQRLKQLRYYYLIGSILLTGIVYYLFSHHYKINYDLFTIGGVFFLTGLVYLVGYKKFIALPEASELHIKIAEVLGAVIMLFGSLLIYGSL